jgi:hypothetical protein
VFGEKKFLCSVSGRKKNVKFRISGVPKEKKSKCFFFEKKNVGEKKNVCEFRVQA